MDSKSTTDSDARPRRKRVNKSTQARPNYGGGPKDSCFKGLDPLAQCLRQYVDAYPARFAVRQKNVDTGRVLIIVLKEESSPDEDRILWEI